jgi:hypothetical protein
MRVAALTPPSLNYWAAKAVGKKIKSGADQFYIDDPETGHAMPYHPSLDWSQALPLLAADWFDIETVLIDWFGPHWSFVQEIRENALIWFVRALVASKFGEEVETQPLDKIGA